MQCLNCHEIIEPGAAFCGNCGQPIQPVPPGSPQSLLQPKETPAPIQQPPQVSSIPLPPEQPNYPTEPSDAPDLPSPLPAPPTIVDDSKKSFKLPLIIIGILIFLILLSVGYIVYASAHKHKPVKVAAKPVYTLLTRCYSFYLADKYNVINSTNSCDGQVFNNSTFDTSTDVYKIISTNSGSNDLAAFVTNSKKAIDKEIATNYPGYVITNEKPSTFAGSDDYIAYFYNKDTKIAAVEAAVLHQTKPGENIFIITHAVNGTITDLTKLEANWKWK
ncbi:MAG: hypothetical protein ACHQT9_02215 [Candidatus Saccharimonadales bacterium]